MAPCWLLTGSKMAAPARPTEVVISSPANSAPAMTKAAASPMGGGLQHQDRALAHHLGQQAVEMAGGAEGQAAIADHQLLQHGRIVDEHLPGRQGGAHVNAHHAVMCSEAAAVVADRINDGLQHLAAHDALSDVRATVALARLLRGKKRRLFDFCLKLRSKAAVQTELVMGRPALHISGMYGTERGCMAVVWPFATHPTNKNEVIVWDLSHDPTELISLTTPQLRERLFSSRQALEEQGLQRLPVKTIHINKSPVVIGNLATLTPARAERWGIDRGLCDRHAEAAARITGAMAGVWPAVFASTRDSGPVDVDEDLYGGFLGQDDRRRLLRLREQVPQSLAQPQPAFDDERLEELVFRWRARNFFHTLSSDEQQRWEQHRGARLHDGAGGHTPLAAWMEMLDLLNEAADERGDERAQTLLSALVDWAEHLAPDA
jgi:exodeoxyribonuclease-1